MEGKHVPDEGPPGLERHKFFFLFYEVVIDILTVTISQDNSKTEGNKRIRSWLAKVLPLDCAYRAPAYIHRVNGNPPKTSECFHEQENVTEHPLQKFFSRMDPIFIHEAREGLGRLKDIFFPDYHFPQYDVPNPCISILHVYLSAFEKQNLFMERTGDRTKRIVKPEECEKLLEEKEALADALSGTRDNERSKFLEAGNILAFGLRRKLLELKDQEDERAVQMIDRIVESGSIEEALCRLELKAVKKIVAETHDFRETFPTGSLAHESLTVIYNYFTALESYLNTTRRILRLFNPD